MSFTESRDRERVRAATVKLQSAGIQNAEKVLRLGAAALVEKCLATGESDVARLAQMVIQGGPSVSDVPRLSERERIVAERNWWQAGYEQGAA